MKSLSDTNILVGHVTGHVVLCSQNNLSKMADPGCDRPEGNAEFKKLVFVVKGEIDPCKNANA